MTETPKELAKEADRGRSARTPWLALSGVTIAISAVVAVILVIVFLVYYLSM